MIDCRNDHFADTMKNSSSNNTLYVSPDWDYKQSRVKDGTIFAFNSSDTCPGYSIHISDWRLRKRTIDVTPKSRSAYFEEAITEFEKALGRAGIWSKEYIAGICAGQFKAQLDIERFKSALQKASEHRGESISIELNAELTMEEIYTPLGMFILTPLVMLAVRYETLYEAEMKPWPYDTPPAAIWHIVKGGFERREPYGMVAASTSSEDLWVVSSLSVDNTLNRKPESGLDNIAISEMLSAILRRTATIQELQKLTQDIPMQTATILKGTVDKIENKISTIHKHVQGVPLLQAELTEAKAAPDALAVEIHSRITDILTPKLQTIWLAMRKSGGCQKDALKSLQRAGIVNSKSTLCRRVAEINSILIANKLSPCNAPAPPDRYNRHGGYESKEGKAVPEELYKPDRDWADDPASRDRTICQYLTASKEDRAHFHELYFGIEDEAKEYRKRHGMKLD